MTTPYDELRRRNEDSVQASLAELRQLELARLAAERKAEEDRKRVERARTAAVEREREEEAKRAEELRRAEELARERQLREVELQHEQALARARIERDAQVEEKRLAVEQARLVTEMARLEAQRPRRRWPMLALVAAVAVAAGLGGLLWDHQRSTEIESQRLQAEMRAGAEDKNSLERRVGELEGLLSTTQGELDRTRKALADNQNKSATPAKASATGRTGRNERTRPAR
ncbi:MAG: hypothetical protein AAGC55_29785, partial [Myxococcota bacterium]